MDVLTYLAKHAGHVVSQEQLFSALWPNTLFSPAPVQRCIAQLRKALGDDARNPTFIVTHPKRGYSLEVAPDQTEYLELSSSESGSTKASQDRAQWRWRMLISLLVLTLLVVILNSWKLPNSSEFVGKLTPLTASDDYDFMPVFSHSGTQMAFIRQTGTHNQIYLRSVDGGRERQLLNSLNNYQSLAWSADDEALYLVVRGDAADRVERLTIATGETQPVFTVPSMPSGHRGELWRVAEKGNTLLYTQANVPLNAAPQSRLMQYHMASDQHQLLLSHSGQFTPYRMALSPNLEQVALAGESGQGEVQIHLYDLQQKHLSPPLLMLPLGFTELAWHPSGERLLVHHMNQLFAVSLTGEQTRLPYHSYQRIFNPVYHPDGHKLVFSLSDYDSDLLELSGPNGANRQRIQSSGEDYLARYSPSGKHIAFVSYRAGRAQVFLATAEGQQLVEDNGQNAPIYRSPVWSSSAEQLVYAIGRELVFYNLASGQKQRLSMPQHFTSVLDWYGDGDALLVATKRDNQSYFERYDITDNRFTVLSTTGVNYAARLDERDQLVFYDGVRLRWGAERFVLPDNLSVQGQVVPYRHTLLFQSGSQLYQFDGQSFALLHNDLPEAASSLYDVHELEQWLFHSAQGNNANIVQLH